MTYDELLKEMKEAVRYIETLEMLNQGGWLAGAKALLAVVELHKPISLVFDGNCCFECSDGMNMFFDYPCPTIQAIEKELIVE